jgi:elongation factor Ts
MEITASMVKALRERSGAGMMECKKALNEANGDEEAALEILRKKGEAQAGKKAGRIAAEGVIGSYLSDDGATAALVEVNCETDFVAKEPAFVEFANAVAELAATQQPADLAALMELKLGDETVEGKRSALIAKIGENMNVRRFVVFTAAAGAGVSSYLHGSRIGVLVESSGGRGDLGRDIAMHVAASRPICVSAADVPADVIASEKEIYTAQAAESGKPPEIVAKMVEGKLRKFVNEQCLEGQPFVKNPDQTVAKLLQSEKAQVNRFARFEVGEGIEKRSDDFAAEVMAQAKGS